METTAIITIFTVSIWFLLYCPTSLYFVYYFYKYRGSKVINKRHFTLSFIILSFSLIHTYIDRFLFILHASNLITGSWIYSVENILYPLIWYGLIWSFLFRFWLLYFDIHFMRAIMDDEWQCIINDAFSTKAIAMNWYLTNKKKWGDIHYTFRYYIAAYLTTVVFSFCIKIVGGELLFCTFLTFSVLFLYFFCYK